MDTTIATGAHTSEEGVRGRRPMPPRGRTSRQLLGDLGEMSVTRHCSCPRCKNHRTLRRLRANFKAADIICDVCGFTAQVKAVTVSAKGRLPQQLLGASWPVQRDRIASHIYQPLYIVAVYRNIPDRIYYVPADFQTPQMFTPRKPLSASASRSGWQGFMYDLTTLPAGIPVVLWVNAS
jgi:type II restriction enzyme